MSVEPDNIIENANDSGVSSGGERSVRVEGAIDFGNDVDLYRFQAIAGEEVILDLDANEFGSALDGRLRLFDSLGNEIGNNDDRPAPGEAASLDPLLSFTVSDTGDYYVGVSRVDNSDYDPNVISDELSTQAVVGEYALEITLIDDSSSDPDNTINEAIATGLDAPGQSASFSDEIDNVADVDIYQVRLDEGDALIVDVDAEAIGSELFASDLRIFDAEGNDLGEVATINDSRLSKDSSASRIGGDPNLTFVAESAGNYYVGVSGGGFDAPTYNPLNGINSDESVASGIYNIDFEIVTVGADNDPDNTIPEAIAIEGDPTAPTVVRDRIDNGDDADLYRVQLDAGETLNLDIDTSNESLESDLALRLFDDSGRELGSADDDFASEAAPSYDPILAFVAETTGEYYVGVAFSENSDYDPVAGTSNLPQQNEAGGGDYDLKIAIDPNNFDEPIDDRDNIIATAIATNLDNIGQSATFSEAIEPIEDVDLYRVQLDAGEGLVLDLDAAEFLPLGKSASGLDSLLRLFDSSGNELALNDDGLAPEEEFSLDSFLSFIASSTGDYYVGVSSAVNSEYNPVTGTSLGARGGNTGDYELNLDLVEVTTIDEDPDNTVSEAIAVEIGSSSSAIFSDTIESETDADLYRVQLDVGDNLRLDLDANEFGSDLDSSLRLFDAAGNELVSVDDAAAPGEESSFDSFIDFTAELAGDYFVGVSDFVYANSQYDPIRGITNLSRPIGNTKGSYDLTIEITRNIVEPVFAEFERVTGTDSNDILSGNENSTFIDAASGDDVVTGASNDDYLIGGAGSDILSGNKGNDTLIGGLGFDVLSGGEGDDLLQGDEDINTLFGGAGADIFAIASNGNNTIADFELDRDKIQLTGASFSDLTIEDVTAESGVVISSGNSITTVLGVNAVELSEADFITT